LTDVSEVVTVYIIRAMSVLMMEAVRTSETSVKFNLNTRRYVPEYSELHTRCRENLKSHKEGNSCEMDKRKEKREVRYKGNDSL
jgi:hypothetical protein